MPKFLEKRLKAEYGADSAIPYKVMNSIGAMHGNKITPKGQAMEAKHNRDTAALSKGVSKRLGRSMPGKPANPIHSAHPHRNLGAHLYPRRGR